jgi:N-acetylglucosaminyldiphosphoundecaprenol N-acetyl-beta-D-mannosaminyltransferase
MGVQTERSVVIFGIEIANLSSQEAIADIEKFIREWQGGAHSIFIVNAHTLNLAYGYPAYRDVISSAHVVLADGTGVRWAAQMRGVRLKDNLVGTDLIPKLFDGTADRGYRYFLLGADVETIKRAAEYSVAAYPGWDLAGFHHGYFGQDETAQLIEAINASRPHFLLVGMGQPKQEYWINAHLDELQVPVCVGVGGLFDHWGGNLKRAPPWVRRQGFEWLQLLLQQPYKWRRYILGNPKFVMRIVRELPRDRLQQRKG